MNTPSRSSKVTICLSLALLALAQIAPASAAGRSVGIGAQCGTVAGIACDDGLWCDPTPDQCQTMDGDGICKVVSNICTKEYRPVCGCDGNTYGNDCTRRAAKVAKLKDGPC